MNSDEAKTRLGAVHDDDWQNTLWERVAKLPRALRSVATQVVSTNIPYSHGPERQLFLQEMAEAAQQLDELSEAKLHKVMSSFVPQVADELTAWWLEAPGFQYSGDPSRRGFRAPNNEAASRSYRFDYLKVMIRSLAPYERDLQWFVQWAGHHHSLKHIGPLLAAAISKPTKSGDVIFDELRSIVLNEHPTAVMGQYAIVGLLRASRPDGWDLMSKMLVAAGRQEGLRTAILDAADEAMLPAFRRILEVIEQEDLTRFASTIHAVDVWVGCGLDTSQKAVAKRIIAQLSELLEQDTPTWSPTLSAEDTYVLMLAQGIVDAEVAIATASQVLETGSEDQQHGAAMVLRAIGDQLAADELVELLRHDNVRIGAWAVHGLSLHHVSGLDLAGALLNFAERTPAKLSGTTPIFEIELPPIKKEHVLRAAFLSRTQDQPLEDFVPHLSDFDGDGKATFARVAASGDELAPAVREALLSLVAGRSSTARDAALKAFEKHSIKPEDAKQIEPLLTRKATATRQGVVQLLTSLPAPERLASAKRLWSTGTAEPRNAACSLIVDLDSPEANELRRQFAVEGNDRHRELLGTDAETGPVAAAALSDIYDPSRIPVGQKPQRRRLSSKTLDKSTAALPGLLDDLFEQHKNTEVELVAWEGSTTTTIADIPPYALRAPFFRPPSPQMAERGLLLEELVIPWWEEWSAEQKADALELGGRALLAVEVSRTQIPRNTFDDGYWHTFVGQRIGELRHANLVAHALGWLTYAQTTTAIFDHALEVAELQISKLSKRDLEGLILKKGDDPYGYSPNDLRHWLRRTPYFLAAAAGADFEQATHETLLRYWQLERWFRLPFEGARYQSTDQHTAAHLFERGLIDQHDLFDSLVIASRGGYLNTMTKRRREDIESAFPKTVEAVDQLSHVAVSAELARGELPTPTSKVIRGIASVEGAEIAMTALARLGKLALSRGYTWGEDKSGTLSHLVRICYPGEHETAESLSAAAQTHGIKEGRLVDFGMYSPQWARLVEEAIGWPGYEDAVWWFHVHTRGRRFAIDAELRDRWGFLSAERTALSDDDLMAGAVDSDWFERMHEELGAKRWKKVLASAKHASDGTSHTRAVTFAGALSGVKTAEEIIERVEKKRHQDSVRALGLSPLPGAKAARKKALLARYEVLREFERTSKTFGAQRQTSEREAVRIGIENLARKAGYRDPLQFSWAMEAEEMADLAAGPVTATSGDVTVALKVDDEGVAQLDVDRGGKKLKTVPAKLRKDPQIGPVRDRKTKLVKQVSRIRRSLEGAMVNADQFEAGDLESFRSHPIVSPMMSSLVLVDENGSLVRPDASTFVDVAGKVAKPKGTLRIAHPSHLLASRQWSDWQHWCFVEEVRQPFRQIFRELYVPTPMELSDEPFSERYYGHQVQPQQANGLFKSRGWEVDFQTRDAYRAFHADDIVANALFNRSYSGAAAVELPVLERVAFTRRGNGNPLSIDQVPPVVFSEAMRDLDLVVSVAHAGEVDPEASASTIEMRKALAHEMVRLLKLDNVEFTENHAIIDGSYGEYSLHLGSGVLHRRPGGHIFIVPVHAQSRGRIFLPFVDDDPRTAEIMTKLLMFSRDKKIQDPTILGQLRAN